MKKISFALLLAVLFMFVACGEDPSPFNQTTSNEAGKDCEQEGTFKCDGKFLLQCAQKEATENQGTETNDQDVAAENQDTETNDQDVVATDQGTEINDNDQNVPAENTVTYAWKQAETCETAEACNATAGVCESPDSDSQPVADNDVTEPTSDADTTTPDADVVPTDTCANDNLGKQCTTDTDCGECMICVTGGKCVKGCTDDADCTMAGTHCNKKLARCLSTLASGKACDETSCPTGCCYAEKGLTGLKCATGASATASTCGLCPQYQIYSPTESKCISAVCSTTTDDCPSINSGATNPPAKCYACKAGEYICKANTSTSGCSAGTVINAAQCVPAGQQCVEGVSECCSGMPCVQGYCY